MDKIEAAARRLEGMPAQAGPQASGAPGLSSDGYFRDPKVKPPIDGVVFDQSKGVWIAPSKNGGMAPVKTRPTS